MAKHDTLSDADGTSLSTSDRGQPVITYVRVGRGMVKVTKYEKQDKDKKQEKELIDTSSARSFGSSQPAPSSAPSIKSRTSTNRNIRTMPAWMPKFKRSKKGKQDALAALAALPPLPDQARDAFSSAPGATSYHAPSSSFSRSDMESRDTPSALLLSKDSDLLSPHQPQGIPTPPSSPRHTQLRATHSHGDLPSESQTGTPDMWSSIAQLESELVARYGRTAVPQFDALRKRVQQMTSAPQQQQSERPPHPTKVSSPGVREESDSDDGALAYLQALGLESTADPSKNKSAHEKQRTSAPPMQPSSAPQPVSVATFPTPPSVQSEPVRYPTDEVSHLEQAHHDALIASFVAPASASLEQYAIRHPVPRPDYITTYRAPSNDTLGLTVDSTLSSRSPSPAPDTPTVNDVDPIPDSSVRRSHRRDLPPRPPPPSTSAPHPPTQFHSPHAHHSPEFLSPESPRFQAQGSPAFYSRNSPTLRPQSSPMSLAPPPPNAPRSVSGAGTPQSQLALPLVRVRITSPLHRGSLRTLPALIMLTAGARAAFAAATWAQMVTYCARNAGVAIARRGGGGLLRVAVEERMAEMTTPGGGRGVGDEEVGFGLGYYVSVEMVLEGEGPLDERPVESSVPVATMSVPLPTTMGEVAMLFRERKDIRKALS